MARTSACDYVPNSQDLRPPICFYGIEGLMDCRNDALFRPALPRVNSDPNFVQKTLVFFGGDVQNFIYLMDQNDPKILYQRWCLETTAMRLGASFPSHHIVIIKPSRIVFEHISCFDNFVESNYLGMPKHTYCYRGLLHLESILIKISKKIRATPSDELFKMLLKVQDDEQDFLEDNPTEDIVWQYELMTAKKKNSLFQWQKNLRLNKYPITLVAFSKGCVVLNQFLYEFHYCKRLEPSNQDSSIVDRIEAMYWLDAGHPGRNNVYPTSRGMLKTLTDLGIEVFVHVSQYQTEDFIRPWIRRQWLEFVEMLKSLNAKLVVRRHLSETTDLRSHFNVLYSFKEEEYSLFESMSTPPLSPPPLPLPHSESPPPPEQTPSERAMMHKHILGISLITPNWNPYLGLQLVLRRPLSEIMARRLAMQTYSDAQSSSDSEDASSSDAQVPSPDAQSRSSSAQSRPNSAAHDYASAQSSSTSATQNNSTAQPSTSGTQNHLYSDAQPSTSTQYNSNSAQSSASGTQNPTSGAQMRPSLNSFMVLLSKKSARIDFAEDHEAAEAYRTAKYFKLESPVIATPTEWPAKTGLNIYTPVNDYYTPLVLNPARLSSRSLMTDSTAAATPRPTEAVPRPTGAVPRPTGAVPRPTGASSADNPNLAPNNLFQAAQPSTSPASRALQSNSFPAEAAPSTSQDRRFNRASQSIRPVPSSQSSSDESTTSQVTRMDVDSTDSSGSDTSQADSAPIVRRILRSRRSTGRNNSTLTKRYNLRSSR